MVCRKLAVCLIVLLRNTAEYRIQYLVTPVQFHSLIVQIPEITKFTVIAHFYWRKLFKSVQEIVSNYDANMEVYDAATTGRVCRIDKSCDGLHTLLLFLKPHKIFANI